MKSYKGIVFDLDGTLLDTIEDLGNSVNEVLAYYGCPKHSTAEYKLLVGNGMKRLLDSSFPQEKFQEINRQEAFKLFQQVYDEKYMETTKPYEGIEVLLKSLQEGGIKLGVNSNKRDQYTKSLVHKFFPDIPFVLICGEREDYPRKPDPAAATEIAAAMGLQPQDVLYIGDSEVDIETGKNAGMDTIGVAWGFRCWKELKKQGAVYITERPADIVKIVAGL